MTKSRSLQAWAVAFLTSVGIATVLLAMPAADAFRHAFANRLPIYIIAIGILSAVAHLVSAAIDVLSRTSERQVIVLRLTLAASALLMAVAFSPVSSGARPLLAPISASAILAVVAAAIARRSRLRNNG